MTPELEDRVCLTATLTGSYEAAAQLSAQWGSAVDDETIRTHGRRMGQRAEAQVQARLAGKALGIGLFICYRAPGVPKLSNAGRKGKPAKAKLKAESAIVSCAILGVAI
jgi:hypothetical protein